MKDIIKMLLASLFRIFPFEWMAKIYSFLSKTKFGKIAIDKIAEFIIPESIILPEGKLFLNKHDPVVSGTLSFQSYETYEVEVFKKKLKEGASVMDVGANIGFFTLIAAAHVKDTGRVIAFEPEVENFNLLKKTVYYNNFSNVTALNFALGNITGTTKLFLSDKNMGDHHTYPGRGEIRKSVEIRVEKIDDIYKENLFPTSVDIVKIDVQGAENEVLKGMAELIKNSPNLILFLEFWPYGLRNANTDPMELLQRVRKDFSIAEISENKKEIIPILDLEKFLSGIVGRSYTNLLCQKL